jgi:hypothetical protein
VSIPTQHNLRGQTNQTTKEGDKQKKKGGIIYTNKQKTKMAMQTK